MASIRLEDEARKDPRFILLGKRLGTSKFDARARVEELWAFCTDKQTHFLSPEIIDALGEFDGLSEHICDPEVGLAEKTHEGIRIKGLKGRIEWLAELRKNAKKGGQARKKKVNPEGSQKATQKGIQNEARSKPESSPLTLTLAPSLTLSPVLKNKESIGANALAPRTHQLEPKGKDPDIGRFVGTYVKAYQARYSAKTRPDLRGKITGQIKNFLRDQPIERACNLIQVYCQMDDPWFIKKHHDFGTFLENLNKVSYALDTGQDANSIDWGKVFNGG